MGFWDLVKSGAKFVGEKYNDFSGELHKYKEEYSSYDDERLSRLYNSTNGIRKIAIASILADRRRERERR